jgi:hypothetical protein
MSGSHGRGSLTAGSHEVRGAGGSDCWLCSAAIVAWSRASSSLCRCSNTTLAIPRLVSSLSIRSMHLRRARACRRVYQTATRGGAARVLRCSLSLCRGRVSGSSLSTDRVRTWTARSRSGRSSSTVACKIACAVSKYRWARWSRIRAICRHGIDGCVASRSSGSALTASPISSRRMRTASKISPPADRHVAGGNGSRRSQPGCRPAAGVPGNS